MSTIKAIYGYRKELGLDDDTARDFYEREVGKRSLKDMSVGEQVTVMQALQAQVRGRGATAEKRLDGPFGPKLQALWISGWNLGLMRMRGDEAMLAWLEGQTGIPHTRFLRNPDDGRKAIEGLKAWLERAGGVVWTDHQEPEDAVLAAQGRLLALDKRDALNDPLAEGWAAWRLGEPVDRRLLMGALGQRIRGQK